MKKYLLLLFCILSVCVYAEDNEFVYLNKSLRFVKDTVLDGHKYNGWFDSRNKPAVFGTYFGKNEYATGQIDGSGKMNGYVTTYLHNVRVFAGKGKINNKTKKVDPSGWGAQTSDPNRPCYFIFCDESTYEKGGLAFTRDNNIYMKNGVMSDAYTKEVELMYEGKKADIRSICQANNVKYVENVNLDGLSYSGGWKDGQPYLYGAYHGLVSKAPDGYYGNIYTVFRGYFSYNPKAKYNKFVFDEKFYEEYKYGYTLVSIDQSTGDTVFEKNDNVSHQKYILSKEGVKFYELYVAGCKDSQTAYFCVTKNLGNRHHWGIIIDSDEFYEGELIASEKDKFDFCRGNYGKSYSANGRFVDQTLKNGKLFFTFANGNSFYSQWHGSHNGIKCHYGECRYPNGGYSIGYFNENDMSKPLYGDVYDKNGNLLTSYVDVKFSDIKDVDAKILELKKLHTPVVNGFGKYENDDIVYEGYFQSCEKSGKGKIIYKKTNNTYEGDWKSNSMEGNGTFIWGDGDKYEGDFKNGKQEGRGTYIWKDGRKYEGYWKDGKKDGSGKLYQVDGSWKDGEWKDGKFSQGTVFLKNEEIVKDRKCDYHGAALTGDRGKIKKNGIGKCTFENGDSISGRWENDELREGKAKLTDTKFSYGEKCNFEGGIKLKSGARPQRHGMGICTYNDGDSINGEWNADLITNGWGVLHYQFGVYNGPITYTVGGGFSPGNCSKADNNNLVLSNGAVVKFYKGCTACGTKLWKPVGPISYKTENSGSAENVCIGNGKIMSNDGCVIVTSSGDKFEGKYNVDDSVSIGSVTFANGDVLTAEWNYTEMKENVEYIYVWKDGREYHFFPKKSKTKSYYKNADGSDAKRKEYKTWEFQSFKLPEIDFPFDMFCNE